MGLIVQLIAHLCFCKGCGKHGHIVFRDGSRTDEFSSIERALAEVDEALIAGKIVAPEAECLRDEIRKSELLTEEAARNLNEVIRLLLDVETQSKGFDQNLSSKGHTLH